ncbi:MAG: PA14 domain-containing protein, partial [Vicinamibacteria bacterium]
RGLGGLAAVLGMATSVVRVGAGTFGGPPGPRGEYFVGPSFVGTPTLTESHGALTTDALREKRAELKSEVFRARWEGVLDVAQPGPYTFALISDDGSWLYVDGRLVVDNGGSHGMVGKDARVDLTAGPHRIRIEYGQDGGDIGLEAIYTPPDGRQRLLGPALGAGVTVWGRPIRSATALAIVSASWSAFVVIALVAWPLARFGHAVRRDASPALTAAIVGLPVAVTVLAGFGIGWGLPDCCGWAPDELYPSYVVRAIDQHFSGGWNDLYPPAHYYLLSLIHAPVVIGSRLGWFDLADPLPYTMLFVLARVASAVMAGVTAAALAMTCRVLGHSWRAALMATLVAVSMPIFVYYGRVANVDMPYVMWYALALYAYAVILARGPSVRRYAWLGTAAALSVGTKDQAYAFFPLIALHLAWRAWASTSGPATRRLIATLTDRFLWTGLIASVLAFAAIHNVLFNAAGFRRHLALLTGETSQNYRMFDRSLAGQAGLLESALIQVPWCLGWLALAAALWGGWVAIRRRDVATLAVVLLPILSWYVCFIAVIGYQYDRFFLGACLGLAIFAGIGLDWIVESLHPRAVGLAIVSAVLIVGVLSGASVPILMRADSRYVVEGWLSEHARPGKVVAFTGRQVYLPRLAPLQGVAMPATADHLAALKPAVVVINWHFSLRARNTPSAWAFYQALEDGRLGYRRVLRVRSAPWTLLGWIDRLSFGGRLASEELTPFSNLPKIDPEIRVYERTVP